MFDGFAQELFNRLPRLEGLSPEEARRNLSRVYLTIIQLRTATNHGSDAALSAVHYLRRLADAMEYHAVFDTDVPDEERMACAFTAAEALALVADYYDHFLGSEDTTSFRLRRRDIFPRVEAAILYLVARYDANAAGVMAKVLAAPSEDERVSAKAAEWCFDVLRAFCEFRLNPLPGIDCPVQFRAGPEMTPAELEDDTIGRLYGCLGSFVAMYMHWLGSEREDGLAVATAGLSQLREALTPRQRHQEGTTPAGIGDEYARVYHLAALLERVIPETSTRSLVHRIPPPPDTGPDVYHSYLKSRAVGEAEGLRGRPLLWPSVLAYVDDCILGPSKHAIVSMPTGSGKSFVAELAVSHLTGSGWCLYLVPTNALAEQVRDDLRKGLRILGTDVVPFIGDREYTALPTETVTHVPGNTVAVMTPEKCALALRLSPQAFESCHLVVFDECHLLGEMSSGRGVTAELVLSQIMELAPECRFLLMSAIVQNPEELAGWIQEATGGAAVPITISWRPTRTLRSAVGVDVVSAVPAHKKAVLALSELGPHRKNMAFKARYSLACGLQGAWQSTNEMNYATVSLPVEADLLVSRKLIRRRWHYEMAAESWVNGSAGKFARFLSEKGIQTLVFIPTSKHYPFSVARDLTLEEDTLRGLPNPPPIVDTCDVLARYEFGIPSEVFALLHRGIAVHTASMIETEKIAVEASFGTGSARTMLATGTLAQGLNLPAVAVVIAGTRIGDPRGETDASIEQRKLSQLLNAAGRAGRAGFANQGLVIAIPDTPLMLRDFRSVEALRHQLNYLQSADNAVRITSGLDTFLDNLAQGILSTDQATTAELNAIAVLGGGDTSTPKTASVLRKSFAAYRSRRAGISDISESAAQGLAMIREEFVTKAGAPSWVPLAAQRAGLDFHLTFALRQAWARVQPEVTPNILTYRVLDWASFLLHVLAYIPPARLARSGFLGDLIRASRNLNDIVKANPELESEADPSWTIPDGWLDGWMQIQTVLEPWLHGLPLVEIASILTGIPVENISPARNAGQYPIPKVIALVHESWPTLALLAGGIVAISEQLFSQLAEGQNDFSGGIPLVLNSLPMCIRYGFDSPESLAWFRFGLRLRRPAHLLATAFPVPSLPIDQDMRDWVRAKRREWLAAPQIFTSDVFNSNPDVVRAVRAFFGRSED